ncbi:MAG: TfoX/Sxy family protein [Lacisediminihabitans sp.]
MSDDPTRLLARLHYIRKALPFEVTTRPMMGGHVGYANGKPFVSLSTGGFGIKLLPADQERLLDREGSRRMQHSPSDPPSKTYIAVGAADLDDDDTLIEWLTLAAATTPTPKQRRN